MPARLACFGAWRRRYSSLCPQRRQLNPRHGAKNRYSRGFHNLKMFRVPFCFRWLKVGPALCHGRVSHRTAQRAVPTMLILGVVFFFSVPPLASAEPLSAADLKALLARVREKRTAAPQVQADFQEEKSVHLLNKPITSSGKMWFQAPNKFRREARGNSPSITVSDGQQLWIYYPKFQSAEHYSLGKRSPLDPGIAAITASLNLENVEATYHITGTKE